MSVSRLTRTATIARTAAWTSLLIAAVSCTPATPASERSPEPTSTPALDPATGTALAAPEGGASSVSLTP